jgi:hypothetical protein
MTEEEEFISRAEPVQEDLCLQRRVWKFERMGWGLLLIIVGLTLAGLFSKGPLSDMRRQTPDGRLHIEYQRFSRNGAQDDVIIAARGAPDQMLYVVIGSRWLEGFSIDALNPQPAPLKSEGRDLVIPMLADAHGAATLYLTLRSNGVGRYEGYVRLRGGESLTLSKFIYP